MIYCFHRTIADFSIRVPLTGTLLDKQTKEPNEQLE